MQQRCKVCGLPDKFNFNVPDDLWARIVPEPHRGQVVCLYCFDEFAADCGIGYAAVINELWFAGRKAALQFGVMTAVDT